MTVPVRLRQFYRGLFGLQFRTTLLLTCVVLAATGLTGAMYLRISARLTLSEAKRHTRDMSKALAAATSDAIEQRDRRRLLRVAESLVSEGDVAYVMFTDVTGELLASMQHGVGNITPFLLEDTRRISVEPINHPRLTVQGEGLARIDVVYPVTRRAILPGSGDLPPTVGYVRLGLGLDTTESRLAEMARSVMGLAVGITLLMVPLGYEVVRRLVRPINRLCEAAHGFASGKLDTRVSMSRRDEFGKLGRAFNSMADEVACSQNQLLELNAELEDRVLQRTNDLESANDRLREMAVRDSLTDLYNRRHLSELLDRLSAEAMRYGTDLTCMMVDLDNFKRVNDSLGHHTGDRLLQLAARVVLASIRDSDVAIRYGGDEFVVLLPRTSPGEARASAERMLTNFRTELMREIPEANITSFSIGLASRERDQPSDVMELVNLADEALYLAKAGGKNRITILRPAAAESRER